MEKKTLGQTLRAARDLGPYTLRQVEEATGISNSYLSQLENDKIKKPSANVLYNLAKMYAMELEVLLGAAGIINDAPDKINHLLLPLKPMDLTKDEEQQLIEYLWFLRHKKT